MNTTEIQTHLGKINITEFSQRHRLPLRTLARVKAGGTPSKGNAALISAAIKRDLRKVDKKVVNVQQA